MHKFIIVGVAGLMLAGCQSTGPNQMIGTGVGAVGGYGVAQAMGAGPRGSAIGAVAGALVGSSVGQSLDQPRPEPVYVAPPPRRYCYSVWDRTPYGMRERTVCEVR
jgi:osmotically inducible lipoprotein OsmB